MVRDESSFLAEINVLPDEHVVFPGYTAAALREIMVRPAVDPAGSRFVPSVEYSEVAGEVQVSEAVVRQRVSRGLRSLRRRMGGGT